MAIRPLILQIIALCAAALVLIVILTLALAPKAKSHHDRRPPTTRDPTITVPDPNYWGPCPHP